ncbi:hypothetical protein AABB24_030177, partial [Solanum stoloniferum]
AITTRPNPAPSSSPAKIENNVFVSFPVLCLSKDLLTEIKWNYHEVIYLYYSNPRSVVNILEGISTIPPHLLLAIWIPVDEKNGTGTASKTRHGDWNNDS